MRKTVSGFNSILRTDVTDKNSTQADSLAGISYLPRSRLEKIHARKNLSPRSIQKKINTFIEETLKNDPEATSLVFEELSTKTGKIHRQALIQSHPSKLHLRGSGGIHNGCAGKVHQESQAYGINNRDSGKLPLRGQTAGASVGLNSRLAYGSNWKVTSHSSMMRPSNYVSSQTDGNGRRIEPEIQIINMSKTGGFATHSSQALKVSTESVLGQTLKKFELGEHDKSKLKTISGVEYYKQHIHIDQQKRLKKYVKDPAGHAPGSKRFVPLRDVEKPSLHGRVQGYMIQLAKEEEREKQRILKLQMSTNADGEMRQTAENLAVTPDQIGQKSEQVIESLQNKLQTPPKSTEPDFFALRNSQRKKVGRGEKGSLQKQHQQNQESAGSKLNTIFPSFTKSKEHVGQFKATAGFKSSSFNEINEETELKRTEEYDTVNKIKTKAIKISNEGEEKIGALKSVKDGTIKKNFDLPAKGTIKNATQIEEITGVLLSKLEELQKLPIFQKPGEVAPVVSPILQESFENTVLKLSSQGEPKEDSKEKNKVMMLKNARINKNKLVNYLKKRYTGRLVQKATSIFDFSNGNLEKEVFYNRLNDVFLNPKELRNDRNDPVANKLVQLKTLKRFAFQLFDMNCDDKLCETDIFVFLEHHKHDHFFEKCLIYDLQDIGKALKEKNQHLKLKDQVMDFSDPNAPKIKSLHNYLESSKINLIQRNEIKEQNVYINTLFQVPVTTDQSKKGEATIDHTDLYSGFDPSYKSTLRKMIGAPATGRAKTIIAEKDTEKNKAQKRNVTDASLSEMRAQGALQFAAEQKKKPMLSYFIHKTDDIYKRQEVKAFLNEGDFESISFKFGLPLVVLDFIDYMTGSDFIETVYNFVNPDLKNNPIERLEPFHQDELRQLRDEIDDQFLPFIFGIFNALGEIEIKNFAKPPIQNEFESKQYITLDSMKKKLPLVFGVKNDFFAEMLFCFISKKYAPLPPTLKINFHQFLTRLMVFWPKKQLMPEFEDAASREWRKNTAESSRNAAMRLFMFEFMRVSGGKMISILDLIKLCCYFPPDSCDFGKECEQLMNKYKQLNIEPRYVHQRQEFGYQAYIKYVTNSCLINFLEFALVGQCKKKIKSGNVELEDNRNSDFKIIKFPLFDWKDCTKSELRMMRSIMSSIFDEKQKGEEYMQTLERRTGQAAYQEVEILRKQNKTIEERKIDRGYDILRTWEIKNVMNDD